MTLDWKKEIPLLKCTPEYSGVPQIVAITNGDDS
jgi:hypothetical protein